MKTTNKIENSEMVYSNNKKIKIIQPKYSN